MAQELAYRHMRSVYAAGHTDDNPATMDEFKTLPSVAQPAAHDDRIAYNVPEQQWVLYNQASPTSQLKAEMSCIRILGFFDTRERAAAHADKIVDAVDVFLCPARKFTLVTPNSANGGDAEEAVQQILQRHEDMIEHRGTQFRENVTQRKMGACANGNAGAPPRAGQGAVPAPAPGADTNVPAITATHEVRFQRYAAISVCCDPSDAMRQHPAVVFHAAFDTEHECKDYAMCKDTQSHVKNHHVDVVCMYSWLHVGDPQLRTDRMVHQYRNAELESIMRAKRNQQSEVDAYRSDCAQHGQEPRLREIDLDVPTPPVSPTATERSMPQAAVPCVLAAQS